MTLLAIPHVQRIRVASKGPAVMPMKILRDEAWTDALCDAVDRGRELGKEVCLHTHFNSPEEISYITRDAMLLLFQRGVKVRNQSVLIRGVNDQADRMVHLVRRLSAINVQPYYVYQHDMVQGVEELRTHLHHRRAGRRRQARHPQLRPLRRGHRGQHLPQSERGPGSVLRLLRPPGPVAGGGASAVGGPGGAWADGQGGGAGGGVGGACAGVSGVMGGGNSGRWWW